MDPVGLGLEFTRQILKQYPKDTVIATCRDPSSAHGLHELQRLYSESRLDIVKLNTLDDDTIRSTGDVIASRHNGTLHRLVNCSAVLHDGDMKPETSYSKLDRANLLRSMETNAIGPILVCQHMLPFLVQGGSVNPSVIVNMSARVSSIGDNRLGGWYSYRSSKAALNQLTKCLALEIARKKYNTAAILLHPGTCDTDLSKPWHRNVPEGKLFSREKGVGQLLDVIQSVTLEDSGAFFAYDRSVIEW